MKNKLLYALSVFILLSLSCSVFGGGNNTRPTAEVRLVPATPTEQPTFTPTPPMSAVVAIPTATTPPTKTPPPVEVPPTETPLPTDTPVPAAKVTIIQVMNVRSGPGTNYPKIGQVSVGHTSEILGRNNDASWLQINTPSGTAWVFANLTQVDGDPNTAPVVDAGAPPPPANTPVPAPPTNTPVPAGPNYPYVIHNIFNQVNEGITQIRGHIDDGAGGSVDGLRVRVRSGSFCTVSIPSGKPGTYPHGNYDILLDNHAKDGTWQVSIVDGPSSPDDFHCTGSLKLLSEEVTVTTNSKEGVVFVEWSRK